MLNTDTEADSGETCAVTQVRSRRSGSAALEAALIFLPFFAIVLAIIDFSVAIFIRNTLTNSVREGVRYGITSRVVTGNPLIVGHDAAIKSIVQRNAFGFMNGTTHANRVSITYSDPETGAIVTGAGSNRSGNVLRVSIAGYPWSWIAPVWRSTTAMAFSAGSADVMEAQPGGIPAR